MLACAGLLISANVREDANQSSGKSSAKSGAPITVKVTNLRNSKGVVRACITTERKQFPKCTDSVKSVSLVVDAKPALTFKFENIQPGRYAIALFHDENNNGKLDRALMMMPREGYGFSRDAKVVMGPPKFESAAIDVTNDNQTQTIRMRYML